MDELQCRGVQHMDFDFQLWCEVHSPGQADHGAAWDAAQVREVVLQADGAVLGVTEPPVPQERLCGDYGAVVVDDRVVAGTEVDGVAGAGAEGQGDTVSLTSLGGCGSSVYLLVVLALENDKPSGCRSVMTAARRAKIATDSVAESGGYVYYQPIRGFFFQGPDTWGSTAT